MHEAPFIPIVEAPVRSGRGASFNPATRYEPLHYVEDPAELDESELRKVPTRFYRDTSKSALATNTSPDVPFNYSLNPYRGCEHGCIYCYARPTHEYLGFSSGLDFETRILVKEGAPSLLASAFESNAWVPQVVALSGNTDPYQPVERKLGITRKCLEVFRQYRNPVSVISKNQLILRDADIFTDLASMDLVSVTVSITSLRPELIRVMEPRTTSPLARFRIIESLASKGIPVGVNIAPIIPGLTDHEMPEIIRRAVDAGASRANYMVLRLPGMVKDLFVEWLHREFPENAKRVIHRLQELRGDSLTDPRFKSRHRGEGAWAEVFQRLFRVACSKCGIDDQHAHLATDLFRRRKDLQMRLF